MAEGISKSQTNPKEALQQVFTLLKARDDTSRFVGLSLLRSLLDANEELRNDVCVIKQCWDAVPNRFLLRLMKAGGAADEAKNMNNLAVAVIHTFANLLPPEQVSAKKMLELCQPLVQVIPRLDAAPQMLAFQALQCMASSSAGTHALSGTIDPEAFAQPAAEDERYLREYLKLYSIAWSTSDQQEIKAALLHAVSQTTAQVKDAALLIEAVASTASQLTVSLLSICQWLGILKLFKLACVSERLPIHSMIPSLKIIYYDSKLIFHHLPGSITDLDLVSRRTAAEQACHSTDPTIDHRPAYCTSKKCSR
jgi:hypothetical protein